MTTKSHNLTRDQIDQAKQIPILDLIGGDTTLRGQTEQYGPCPFCGGVDRFHVRPDDNLWFCRHCIGDPQDNGWCDVIEYVRRKYQTDFIGALQALGVCQDLSADEQRTLRPITPTKPGRKSKPEIAFADWQVMAMDAAIAAQSALAHHSKARHWLNQRGISDQAIAEYCLGYTPGGEVCGVQFKMGRGIVIPHWHRLRNTLYALKVRRPVPSGQPNKYYCATGSRPSASLYNADSLVGREICFVTERELDAIALHSQIGDWAAVVTLGSKGARLDERWLPELMPIKRFYIATDQGEDEAAATYWLSLVGQRGKRVFFPEGCKDACEAAMAGVELRGWARKVAG